MNSVHERWWYPLVKVCRRWRDLILGSAPHLRLCLVCLPGTPVAEMLAHSPPLPLIIDYDHDDDDLTPEDEQGIMFALEHRDRMRRICLCMPIPCLQKVITAMGDQFPVLEYLYISLPTTHKTHLALPATFKAPQLNYLMLNHFPSPIGSLLLATAVNLVRLVLQWVHPSTDLYPNHLLQALSLLPQLQHLTISFSSAVPNRDVERHMLHTPNITHAALLNFRFFVFAGVSAYLEALLSHMNAPLLHRFDITFFNQLSFYVPRLGQFVTIARNIRSSRVKFLFCYGTVIVFMHSSLSPSLPTLTLRVDCDHLDWQVSSMAQILNVLDPLFSAVDLTFDYKDRSHMLSSEWHNQADSTQWRKLLGSFKNVETLRVHGGLVGDISRCLALDGEPASMILPELKTLVCPTGSRNDQTFAAFIHDREVAGLHIDLFEDAFPAGDLDYRFDTPAGVVYVS